MSFEHHDYLHLFCMYAYRIKGYEVIDGKIDLAQSNVDAVRAQLRIDERCFQFGKFAVIIPAVAFLDYLKRVLREQKYSCVGRLVEYYDEETFHGQIAWNDIPFKKQRRFSYQSEFRLCVSPKTKDEDPLLLSTGDISSFTALVDAASLNDLFELKLVTARS